MNRMWSTMALVGIAGLLAAGCRDTGSNNFTPTNQKDMSGGGPGPGSPDLAMQNNNTGGDMAMMGGNPTDDMGGGNKTYIMTSIASMRQQKSGPYELDNVVSISPSVGGSTLTVYLQDPMGGDYSAISVKCSSNSMTHPCPKTGPVYPTLKNIGQGHSVTVQGTYIKSSMNHIEEFYLDSITDNGNANSVPAPATLQLADIQRGAMKIPTWFQKVNVALPETLKVYDLAPVEFQRNAGMVCMTMGCPCQFGFGMAPSSAMLSPGPACNGMVGPMGQTANAKEVLIGTDFFVGFTFSSDCACSAKYKDTQITPTNILPSGKTLSGILVFSSQYMTTNYYQYVAPITNGDFPVQ